MFSVSIVNTLQYRPELCAGCEMCGIVCPHRVFAMNGRTAMLVRPRRAWSAGLPRNCPTVRSRCAAARAAPPR